MKNDLHELRRTLLARHGLRGRQVHEQDEASFLVLLLRELEDANRLSMLHGRHTSHPSRGRAPSVCSKTPSNSISGEQRG